MRNDHSKITGQNIMRVYVCLATLLVVVLAEEAPNRRRRLWDTSDNDTSPLPPPYFLPTPDRVTVKEGNMAKLECAVLHIGTKHVIWRKTTEANPLTIGRRTFVDDERITVQHIPLQSNWTLLIKQVRLNDAGEYECQVSSKNRDLRRSVFLTVKVNPKKKVKSEIKISGKTYVEKGSSIVLSCNVTGTDSQEVDWFRNGQKLSTDGDKVNIYKAARLNMREIDSILTVTDATLEDSGIYVCRTSEMSIDSTRVDVLNADTNNVKRGTEKDSESKSRGGGQQEELGKTENNSRKLTTSCTDVLFTVFFSVLLSRMVHTLQLPT